MNNISITKILLLFYILIGNSLLQPLLSKQWIDNVKNNRIMQHIIGFTTMLTLAILVSEQKEEYSNLILYSIVAYLWFIFSTKMDIHFNIIIIVLLLGNYLYDNYLENQITEIINDKILNQNIKNKLIEVNDKKSKYAMFSIMILIVVGMFTYSNKKEVQYGGGYNAINFLFY